MMEGPIISTFQEDTFKFLKGSLTLEDLELVFKEAIELHIGKSEYVFLEFIKYGQVQPIPEDFFKNAQAVNGNEFFEFLSTLDSSIRISNLHISNKKFKRAVTELYKSTEKVFTCNLYFTPSIGKDCLDLHIDPQQTYAFQWRGQKKWLFPLADNGSVIIGSLPPQNEQLRFKEIISSPGEVLFVPIGTPHKAALIGDSISVHVSFAENVLSALDILKSFQKTIEKKFLEKSSPYKITSPGDKEFRQTMDELISLIREFNAEDFEQKLLDERTMAKLFLLQKGRNRRSI